MTTNKLLSRKQAAVIMGCTSRQWGELYGECCRHLRANPNGARRWYEHDVIRFRQSLVIDPSKSK